MLAAVVSLTLCNTLLAQGAPTGSAPVELTQQVRVKGISAVTSLADWPCLQLSVNQDAYIAVLCRADHAGVRWLFSLHSRARVRV